MEDKTTPLYSNTMPKYIKVFELQCVVPRLNVWQRVWMLAGPVRGIPVDDDAHLDLPSKCVPQMPKM